VRRVLSLWYCTDPRADLSAREEERVWVKRQTDGELDDTRLTEGLTGESAVYKRRGMAKPELGRPQFKCVLACASCGVVLLMEMRLPGQSAFGSCLILVHQCEPTCA
jgi:hypothetical protein